MTNMTYRYLHLDVFTDRPFGGNQLAVFPFPRDPAADTMQAITKEMNFSESTFVFPAETPGTDVRVRIFTPGRELPMAGHPTIGTAFALAHEGVIPRGRERVVFGLGIGPTPVELSWDDNGLAFAWMTQLRPDFGAVFDDLEPFATALGVGAGDIRDTRLPVQSVSCGLPFVFVPLATRAAVDRAWPDRRVLKEFFTAHGSRELEVFVFSPERAGDDATVYSRMFAPALGVAEDPATGAASGPLGCYLVRHGVVERTRAGEIVSLQGVKMGRPSRVHIAIDLEGNEITRVRVGGTAVVVGEGRLVI